MFYSVFFDTESHQSLPKLEEMQDIIEIQSDAFFKNSALFYILIGILITLLLLAVGIYFFKKWQKNRKLKQLKKLKPHEKALFNLKELKNKKLVEKGDFRKHYFYLSEIFRQYITDRFDYPAIDKTTFEIVGEIKKIPDLPQTLISPLKDFLNQSDLIKFGSLEIKAENAVKDKDWIEHFIHQTKNKIELNQNKDF